MISDLWRQRAEERRLRLAIASGKVLGRGPCFDANIPGGLGFDVLDPVALDLAA